MFYLTTHSTHFIYGYMASDIWLRTILIARKETRCRHTDYSYQLKARVLLYAPSYNTDRITHTKAFVTPVVEHWLEREIAEWVHPMKDRSDDLILMEWCHSGSACSWPVSGLPVTLHQVGYSITGTANGSCDKGLASSICISVMGRRIDPSWEWTH